MDLFDQISNDIKEAMKAKDKVKLETLRNVKKFFLEEIAEDFSAYLDLYYKYRDDYGVEEILAGQVKPAVYARLLNAPFDERLSLVSLILSGLNTRFTASRQADAVADACYAFLREAKQGFSTLPADIPDGELTLFGQMVTDYDAETQRQRAAGLLGHDALNTRLQVYAALRSWDAELRRANAVSTQPSFDLLRTQFQSLAEARIRHRKPPAPRWKLHLTLWRTPLPKARRWWCSSRS